jgi:hypothetical protein
MDRIAAMRKDLGRIAVAGALLVAMGGAAAAAIASVAVDDREVQASRESTQSGNKPRR